MAQRENLNVSLCPLSTRQDLIESCAELIKITWPCSKPERLHRMAAEETSGLPCCLVLIEHREDAPDAVIGHTRFVKVMSPETPPSAYVEAFCIHPSKRGLGLGSRMLDLAERHTFKNFGCKQSFLICHESLMDFYKRISYQLYPVLKLETVGANLLSHFDGAATWYGNKPRKGWEFVYSDGPHASKEDMEMRIFGHLTMRKYLKDYY
ncbi:N-alpha-acetyltransferase 80-like [Patiria miniata]|uniref:N-acetyltransferase domain-containing protein n=1 Tax=Patiria miniata TaxID=46514 RepID=A0A913ZA92_PATMI|nr:N-alpha-acetyltransferase 80-like [Patiria miniata]